MNRSQVIDTVLTVAIVGAIGVIALTDQVSITIGGSDSYVKLPEDSGVINFPYLNRELQKIDPNVGDMEMASEEFIALLNLVRHDVGLAPINRECSLFGDIIMTEIFLKKRNKP